MDLVPDNRATQGEAPGVALVVRLRSADVLRVLVARLHVLVLEILECLTAESIRSAPRHDAHQTGDVAAMFSGSLRDVHAKFANGELRHLGVLLSRVGGPVRRSVEEVGVHLVIDTAGADVRDRKSTRLN